MRMHVFLHGWRAELVNHARSSTETVPEPSAIIDHTAAPQGRGTILLVEDESFLRDITCDILESAGYRVLKTRNAVEALSAFKQFKPIVRLLLTDVVLPGQNGRDLANDLRALCPELRIIFVSG
jgi:two-component system cell cycle sensor histidine kinase/response regulator CckA